MCGKRRKTMCNRAWLWWVVGLAAVGFALLLALAVWQRLGSGGLMADHATAAIRAWSHDRALG